MRCDSYYANGNRNSYRIYKVVPFSMILSDS